MGAPNWNRLEVLLAPGSRVSVNGIVYENVAHPTGPDPVAEAAAASDKSLRGYEAEQRPFTEAQEKRVREILREGEWQMRPSPPAVPDTVKELREACATIRTGWWTCDPGQYAPSVARLLCAIDADQKAQGAQ
jgi:hypothetical protein